MSTRRENGCSQRRKRVSRWSDRTISFILEWGMHICAKPEAAQCRFVSVLEGTGGRPTSWRIRRGSDECYGNAGTCWLGPGWLRISCAAAQRPPYRTLSPLSSHRQGPLQRLSSVRTDAHGPEQSVLALPGQSSRATADAGGGVTTEASGLPERLSSSSRSFAVSPALGVRQGRQGLES